MNGLRKTGFGAKEGVVEENDDEELQNRRAKESKSPFVDSGVVNLYYRESEKEILDSEQPDMDGFRATVGSIPSGPAGQEGPSLKARTKSAVEQHMSLGWQVP